MARYDTFLYGRRCYKMVQAMGSKPMPGITNYVFSHTLHNVAEGYSLVQDDVKNVVTHIKQQNGKDIAVFGGANLLASLLDMRVVDELAITIIPVLLGRGKPMVDALAGKVWLSLTAQKTYGNGSVQLTYDIVYDKP